MCCDGHRDACPRPCTEGPLPTVERSMKAQPVKPKSMDNTHSLAEEALLGLTHSLINPSVQSCLYLLPFKETSCVPNSILASASGKSSVGQLVPRVTQKSRTDKMGFGREITYHATGNKDPIMGVGGAHSPWHRWHP